MIWREESSSKHKERFNFRMNGALMFATEPSVWWAKHENWSNGVGLLLDNSNSSILWIMHSHSLID